MTNSTPVGLTMNTPTAAAAALATLYIEFSSKHSDRETSANEKRYILCFGKNIAICWYDQKIANLHITITSRSYVSLQLLSYSLMIIIQFYSTRCLQ